MAPPQGAWWRLLFFLVLLMLSTGVLGNAEGDALTAFRQSLIDHNNVLQSWDPTLPNPCPWFHVTCNANNSVVRVDLGNAGLSGTLAPQLGVLKSLQYLELFENNITGTIPPELGSLTALVSLDLYENRFIGTIPESLGQLRNLQFLRLDHNGLSGSIPASLTTIRGLEILNLSNNELTGSLPIFCRLRNLITLDLSNNKF